MSRRPAAAPFARVVVCLVAVAVASSAEATGTLRGRVVSPSGAARAGVTVRVADDTAFRFETRTDDEGRFQARGLAVGHYTVSVFGDGLEWVETVDVRVNPGGETVLVVPVREVAGEVFVRRTGSPVVRTASTEGEVVVEVDDRRPLPGRSPLGDLVAWLPGAVPRSDDPWRARSPSPRGSTAGPAVVELDGVDATGAGNGWRGPGAPLGSTSVVRAVTTATTVDRPVGADGTLLLAVRGGEAALAADVGLLAGGTSAAAADVDRPEERELGLAPQRAVELVASVGGAVADDRVTWFLAVDGRDASDAVSTTRVEAASGGRAIAESARDARQARGLAKLRWLPSSSVRLGLTAAADRDRRTGDVAGTLAFDPAGAPPSDVGFDADTGRWLAGLSSSLVTSRGDLLELTAGRLVERLDATPHDDRPSLRDQTVDGRWSGGVGSGAVAGGAGFARHRDEVRSTSARFATTWGVGDHELAAGVSFHEVDVERRWSPRDPRARCVALGPGAVRLDPATGSTAPLEATCSVDGSPGVEAPFGAGDRLRLADDAAVLLVSGAAGPGSRGRRRETAVWVADRWMPSAHVTVRGGVRLSALDLEVERPAPAELELGLSDRLGWGLGVAWDPEGSGRTRVWAHVGRRRPTVSVDLDAGALFGDPAPRIRLDPPSQLGPSIGTVAGVREVAPVAVWPQAAAPAWDELAVGGEWELFGDLAVGTEVALRRWHRELVRVWIDEAGLQVLAPTGATVDRHPLTHEPLSDAFTVPDADREEQSVTVSGVKRYRGGWQLATAVTWSRSTGTPAPGRGADVRHGDGPVVVEPFEEAAMAPTAVARMNERRWQLRLEGSYAFEPGPVVGVSGWWMSGAVAPRTGAVARDLELDQRVIDGTTRLADPWTLDARLEWPWSVGGGELGVVVEVRNLFDRQAPVAVDSRWSVLDERASPLAAEAQRTRDGWATPRLRQAPRTVWAGVRWSWR